MSEIKMSKAEAEVKTKGKGKGKKKSEPVWKVDEDQKTIWFGGAGPRNSGWFSNMTFFWRKGKIPGTGKLICAEMLYVLFQLQGRSPEFKREYWETVTTGPKAKELWGYFNVSDDSTTLLHTNGRYPGKGSRALKEFAVDWRKKGVKPVPELLKPNKGERKKFTSKDVDKIKQRAMRKAHTIRLKYDAAFRDFLIRHRGWTFVEDMPDKIWGRGEDGNGRNLQGKLLMELAEALTPVERGPAEKRPAEDLLVKDWKAEKIQKV